jgi:hypothetical protein
VLLYDDQNGDALHQETEPVIENGAVSISGSSGQYSQTSPTLPGIDPVCFEKVPVGTYNISVAAPSGYNPTTLLNYTLEVKQGDVRTGTSSPVTGSTLISARRNPANLHRMMAIRIQRLPIAKITP